MTKSGVLPADWKYRVRIDRFSGGSSLDVSGKSPRPIYAADPQADGWVRHAEPGEQVLRWREKYTLATGAVHGALTDLVNGHNHGGSDIQPDHFDVKFYGSVHIHTAAGVPQFVAEHAPGGAVMTVAEQCSPSPPEPVWCVACGFLHDPDTHCADCTGVHQRVLPDPGGDRRAGPA